jgi:hypothetical protein
MSSSIKTAMPLEDETQSQGLLKEDCAALARPRLVLRIGLIGNSASETGAEITSDAVRGAARQILETVLEEIASIKAACVHCREERPLLRFVSGLADGADQALTEVAMGLTQGTVNHELLAILPCPEQKYCHISVTNKVTFNDLAQKASWTIALDGNYEPDPVANTPTSPENRAAQRRRHRSYQAQAWFLRQQTDLLVAIWDRANSFKLGGTEDTIQSALRMGLPVIWIDPHEPECVHILREPPEIDPSRCSALEWRNELKAVVSQLLAFPGEANQANPETAPKRQTSSEVLNEFFGPLPPPSSFRQSFWIFGMQILSLLHSVQATLVRHGKPIYSNSPPHSTAKPHAAQIQPYAAFKQRADRNAAYCAGLYRGAFMLNYLLGWLAVLLSSAALAILALEREGEAALWPVAALGILELLVIIMIIKNVKDAHQNNWQLKAINYRYLAEMLRQMDFLAPLACSTPSSRAPMQWAAHDPRQTWMSWLFRAVVRESPPAATADGSCIPKPFSLTDPRQTLSLVIDSWVGGQIEHHAGNAERMASTYETIEFWGKIFFFIVGGLVLLHIGLDCVPQFHSWRSSHFVGVGCLLLGIILPAAVVTLNGFRYQAECRRLKERSENMAAQLKRFREDLIDLLQRPPHPEGCDSWEIASGIYALGQVMIDEVTDWQIVYRMHEISTA